MMYEVKLGDTLWQIAKYHYRDPRKWTWIARDNNLVFPDRLWVGQHLFLQERGQLPSRSSDDERRAFHQSTMRSDSVEHAPSLVPARAFFFVLADEIDPFRAKVVRKVIVSPAMAEAYARQLGRPVPTFPNPERFGIRPGDLESPVSLGRHAMGMKPSSYSSASSHPLGASRITGSRFWVDVDGARAAGATFHETEEIVKDLDRIAAKTRKSADLAKIEFYKNLVRGDSEVLIKGAVPPSAIKGAGSMAIMRSLQGVQMIGFVMSAVDLGNAASKSAQKESIKPIAAEGLRQAGGWASAWAGMKLGAAAGAAVGLATGPGALIAGGAGAIVGGVGGYFAFDWIADHIDEN